MVFVDLLKYIFFGFSILIGILSFSFSDDLKEPKFYKKFLIAAIISFGIGVITEFNNTFNLERGLTLLIMSISIIYLGYYKVFTLIFTKWKGVEPCFTSHSSKIGGIALGGFWSKYPKNRRIMWTDFLYTFLQTLVPIFTFFAFAFLILK